MGLVICSVVKIVWTISNQLFLQILIGLKKLANTLQFKFPLPIRVVLLQNQPLNPLENYRHAIGPVLSYLMDFSCIIWEFDKYPLKLSFRKTQQMGIDLGHCTYTPLHYCNDLHFSKVRAIYPGLDNNVVGTADKVNSPRVNEEYLA